MASYVLVDLSHTAFTSSRTSDKTYSGVFWSQGFLKYYFKQKIFPFKNKSCYYFEGSSKLLKKCFLIVCQKATYLLGFVCLCRFPCLQQYFLKVKFTETFVSPGEMNTFQSSLFIWEYSSMLEKASKYFKWFICNLPDTNFCVAEL